MISLLQCECNFLYNEKDIGKGRMELIKSEAKENAYAFVVFRNPTGNILFQGNFMLRSDFMKSKSS